MHPSGEKEKLSPYDTVVGVVVSTEGEGAAASVGLAPALPPEKISRTCRYGLPAHPVVRSRLGAYALKVVGRVLELCCSSGSSKSSNSTAGFGRGMRCVWRLWKIAVWNAVILGIMASWTPHLNLE